MTGGTDEPILPNGELQKSEAQVLKKPFSLSTLAQTPGEMTGARAGENRKV